jgi:transcriptional regulator with XRE-family HTH domain
MTMPHHSEVAQGVRPEWTPGDYLRKARLVAGYKDQQRFADLLGIARKSVFNYENDITVPNLPVYEKWARVTGVDLDWLMGKRGWRGNERPSPPPPHAS